MLVAVRFFYLVLLISLASQGIFYFIAVGRALQLVSLESFIELRKAIDAIIELPIRVLYYTSILVAVGILLSQYKKYESILFITVALSFVFLLGDVYLAVTKSVPLNALIRGYTAASDRQVFEIIRLKWLFYIQVRGMLAVSGLLILLAGFVHDFYYVKNK